MKKLNYKYVLITYLQIAGIGFESVVFTEYGLGGGSWGKDIEANVFVMTDTDWLPE